MPSGVLAGCSLRSAPGGTTIESLILCPQFHLHEKKTDCDRRESLVRTAPVCTALCNNIHYSLYKRLLLDVLYVIIVANIKGGVSLEIRFTVNEDGSVVIESGSAPKVPRPNKGKSLLCALDSYVSLDIETTGLSPRYDEIIELGAVKYKDGECIDTFTSLVKPENPIDEFISNLTGITNEMLAGAPSLATVLPHFIDFVGSNVIVGHNVNFDINFLYDACNNLKLPSFSNDYVDTMRLARRMYQDLPNHKLDTLISYFGLDQRGLHRSLSDCELTAVCYQKMMADTICFKEAIKASQRTQTQKKQSLKELMAVDGFENPDSLLYGRVCVFTGTLESFTRREAAQLVVNIGGIVEDRVTKRTNYLILGNNDYCKAIKDGKSNKQKNAEKLISEGADLSIIPESVFLDILYEDNAFVNEPEDAIVELPAEEMEQTAYDLVAPALKELLVSDNLSENHLIFKQNKTGNTQYSSICLFSDSNLFCRISFRGKQPYLAIPSTYVELIPTNVEYKVQKSDPNYCRIPIVNPDDLLNYLALLKKLLEVQIATYPSDFGCCSRYEACSDVMHCVHPDPNMALCCAYRKNMKAGKIFYGKNRNI